MSWHPIRRVPVGACAWKVPRLNWHLNNIVEMQSVHWDKRVFGRCRVYLGHAPKFHASFTSFHPQNRMLIPKPRIFPTEKHHCEIEFFHLVSVGWNANSMRMVSIASHGFRVLNFEYLAELASLATSATWIRLHSILKRQRLISKAMPSICSLRFERLCCLEVATHLPCEFVGFVAFLWALYLP